MFEVLAFVYENYWGGEDCPSLPTLQRQLNAVGFDRQEIDTALLWLEDLKSATLRLPLHSASAGFSEHTAATNTIPGPVSSHNAMRVLNILEQDHLGPDGWGFLTFLSSIGALPLAQFELVMDRAMAAPGDPMSLDDLKLIVLMMFWSLGKEPNALVLDELCDSPTGRLPH